MTVYHTFKVRKKTLTNLDIIMLVQFMKLMRFWEMFTSRLKNLLSIFVEILRLYGGLTHLIFLLRLLALFVTMDISFCRWNV